MVPVISNVKIYVYVLTDNTKMSDNTESDDNMRDSDSTETLDNEGPSVTTPDSSGEAEPVIEDRLWGLVTEQNIRSLESEIRHAHNWFQAGLQVAGDNEKVVVYTRSLRYYADATGGIATGLEHLAYRATR